MAREEEIIKALVVSYLSEDDRKLAEQVKKKLSPVVIAIWTAYLKYLGLQLDDDEDFAEKGIVKEILKKPSLPQGSPSMKEIVSHFLKCRTSPNKRKLSLDTPSPKKKKKEKETSNFEFSSEEDEPPTTALGSNKGGSTVDLEHDSNDFEEPTPLPKKLVSSTLKVSSTPPKILPEKAEDSINNFVPDGWRRQVVQRTSGHTAGMFDVYYYSPNGKKLRSGKELKKYCLEKGIDVDLSRISFTPGRRCRLSQKSSGSPTTTKSHKIPKTPKISGSPNTITKSLKTPKTPETPKHMLSKTPLTPKTPETPKDEETPKRKRGRPKGTTSSTKKKVPSGNKDIVVPEGWSRQVVRSEGTLTPGNHEVYYFSPKYKKIRSMKEVEKYCLEQGVEVDLSLFNFNPSGEFKISLKNLRIPPYPKTPKYGDTPKENRGRPKGSTKGETPKENKGRPKGSTKTKKEEGKQLVPVFMKKRDLNVEDLEVSRSPSKQAIQDFQQSAVSKTIKKKLLIEKRIVGDYEDDAVFSAVSHVQQVETDHWVWNLTPLGVKPRPSTGLLNIRNESIR